MPRLKIADPREIESVYAQSHAMWGAGLGLRDYLRMWGDLQRTAWGKRNYSLLVWIDESGEILSSMKLYRPELRIAGRTVRAAGFGAVFTPEARRRRGHAAAMLRAALAEAREWGDRLGLLFSDIGVDYYAALGFVPLPAEETWGALGSVPGPLPRGWELRPMQARDLALVRHAHDDACANRSVAVLRDAELWEFLMLRAASFFGLLDGSSLDHRYQVALHEGRFAGYLIAVRGGGAWVVREVGALGGELDAMTTILRLGAAEARRVGLRDVYGWFPRDLAARIPEWSLRQTPRQRAIPMMLALDADISLARLDSPEAAFIPYLDQF